MLKKIKDIGSGLGEGIQDASSAAIDGIGNLSESAGDGLKSIGGAAAKGVGNIMSSDAIGDGLSSGLDKLKDNPALLAMLLGGAGAGVAGGYAESQRKGHAGETGEERRERILRNALLFGGGGLAAGGLAGFAHHSLNTALPEGDTDPASSVGKPALRLAGAGTVGAGFMRKGLKSERTARNGILKAYADAMKTPEFTGSKSTGAGVHGDITELLKSKDGNKGLQGYFEELAAKHKAMQHPRGSAGNPGYLNDAHAINKSFGKSPNLELAGVLSDTAKHPNLTRNLKRLLGDSKPSKRWALPLAALAAGASTPEIMGLGAKGVKEIAM